VLGELKIEVLGCSVVDFWGNSVQRIVWLVVVVMGIVGMELFLWV
jgi:hypothetical protein